MRLYTSYKDTGLTLLSLHPLHLDRNGYIDKSRYRVIVLGEFSECFVSIKSCPSDKDYWEEFPTVEAGIQWLLDGEKT